MSKDKRTQQEQLHESLKRDGKDTDRPQVPTVREVLFGRKR